MTQRRARCELPQQHHGVAELLLERTELELRYSYGSKMTDFAIHLFGGCPLGVSVTRAYKWRPGHDRPSSLDVSEARRLLVKKLAAINVSSR